MAYFAYTLATTSIILLFRAKNIQYSVRYVSLNTQWTYAKQPCTIRTPQHLHPSFPMYVCPLKHCRGCLKHKQNMKCDAALTYQTANLCSVITHRLFCISLSFSFVNGKGAFVRCKSYLLHCYLTFSQMSSGWLTGLSNSFLIFILTTTLWGRWAKREQ